MEHYGSKKTKNLCKAEILALFTLEGEKIVWTDKSSRVKKRRIKFSTYKLFDFTRLSVCQFRQSFENELFVYANK